MKMTHRCLFRNLRHIMHFEASAGIIRTRMSFLRRLSRGQSPLHIFRSNVTMRNIALIAAIVLLFGGGGLFAWAATVTIPSIDNFENRRVGESTKIYDRTGNVLLYDVHGTMRRTSVPLDAISQHLRNATIAIEDDAFYDHNGFRPMAFLRAVLVNLRLREGYRGQGGSTVTQQVVKNALLTKDKTIIRKLKEILLALKLERVYTKDEILTTYLNENPYGGTIYGVQEASQFFFGADAKDVTLAQAAYMAALPQAPTRYSPYGNHRDELESRKNHVLKKMHDLDMITSEEYDLARSEQVQFKDAKEAGIKAPHFVFYVREYLEEKYGVDAVNNGGLKVITTLDYDLQKKAEDIVRGAALKNEKNFNASNAGLVAIEPKTGQILTMVGSRGYFDEDIDGKVNVTLSNRQPGSSFKPFVYATAFAKGYTPETIVFDLPTQFSTACAASDAYNSNSPCYAPVNYDGKFHGPMTLRDALAQSVNIASVKVLYLAGIADSIKTARAMGISTLEESGRYGLTLVLGGGEVSLLEETSAYGVFGNDGVRNSPTGTLQILDGDGELLEAYESRSERVLDSEIAKTMNDVLSDNVARTPGFGANSPLNFTETSVAVKTGTTNDYRDAWIIGYTPGISVGAWAGNNDNSPMVKRVAAFIVAPMWHEVMELAIEKYPAESFAPPAPQADYDSLPPVLRGLWNTNPSEGTHDILYWVNRDNPRSGRPQNAWRDSQFAYWEYPVSQWALGTAAPPGAEPGGEQLQSGSFAITSPQNGSIITAQSILSISASHPRPEMVTRVVYYLNDTYIGQSTAAPYTLTTSAPGPGPAVLRATAETASGTEKHTITFTIQ